VTGSPRSPVDTVRAQFNAYRAQNLEAADRLLGDDLTFTSPQDDHIDKADCVLRGAGVTGDPPHP
jgi:hypothetical protein